MKDRARLIIPVWGERYLGKVLSITLPAVLAPGNLPALRETFDVELAIVTESRLFDMVKGSPCFQAAASVCTVQLLELDDLLTEVPGDYGMVLTYALFRGFADLGAQVTQTYLLFLNADFVISDGSLRHIGKLMSEGQRVIHAPSFRVVLEDVWPQLQAQVNGASCTLQLPSRDLARLALAHKHPTVKARTINQRLCHQTWMDQYYWYVDEETMIGYQSPVALIAVKPERVVTEPGGFWDYSFLPEAAPSATPVFITDSDDFFMIEPQSRDTGSEMIRIGWFPLDEMAGKESLRSTQQHRESGRQLLKIHAGDLPGDLDRFIADSRSYMNELYRRLSLLPASHEGHPLLGRWFEEARERRRGGPEGSRSPSAAAEGKQVQERLRSRRPGAKRMSGLLRSIYRRTFGAPPEVGKLHPLWGDMAPICRKIAELRTRAPNLLWIASPGSVLEPLLSDRVTPALLASDRREALLEKSPYDGCVCQLTIEEFLNLEPLYERIRPLVRDGGHIIVYVFKTHRLFDGADLLLSRMTFPSVDVSEIHFFGTMTTTFLRLLHMRASQSFPRSRFGRSLAVVSALVVMAPTVWLANACARRRDTTVFSSPWTSLLAEFTVRRGRRHSS